MDQLKQALNVVKKYHFWILCGLIVLLYVGVWFMSTSSMSQVTRDPGVQHQIGLRYGGSHCADPEPSEPRFGRDDEEAEPG